MGGFALGHLSIFDAVAPGSAKLSARRDQIVVVNVVVPGGQVQVGIGNFCRKCDAAPYISEETDMTWILPFQALVWKGFILSRACVEDCCGHVFYGWMITPLSMVTCAVSNPEST